MADLGSVPYRRSIALDWATPGCTAVGVSVRTDYGALLVKAGRFADLTGFFAGALQMPPSEANRLHLQAQVTRLWLGPREWSLLATTARIGELMNRLSAALADVTSALIDVSDRSLILDVTGQDAPALLAKGTSLDPVLLGAGACCRTRFASLPATLFRSRADGSFSVVTDRATAPYLHAWLARAIEEGPSETTSQR